MAIHYPEQVQEEVVLNGLLAKHGVRAQLGIFSRSRVVAFDTAMTAANNKEERDLAHQELIRDLDVRYQYSALASNNGYSIHYFLRADIPESTLCEDLRAIVEAQDGAPVTLELRVDCNTGVGGGIRATICNDYRPLGLDIAGFPTPEYKGLDVIDVLARVTAAARKQLGL
jgi:hypothetical protein